jgi:quercetin dioxygenase-like cupin family protein
MNIAANPQVSLADRMKAHTGRFVDKAFDWNAFPSNAGFDELARAQMRYIVAGGSPKVGDPTTLKADNFTLSLIYKEPGRYAACHSHEIEESFLILSGALIVGWEKHGEVVEVNLGPKDMILNAREIGHGFRVDGVEPVLMSISVDVGKPLPPVYHYHPKQHASDLARSFGALPGKTMPFDRSGQHEIQRLMADYVVRYTELPTIWDPMANIPAAGPPMMDAPICLEISGAIFTTSWTYPLNPSGLLNEPSGASHSLSIVRWTSERICCRPCSRACGSVICGLT